LNDESVLTSTTDAADELTSESSSDDQNIDIEVVCVWSIGSGSFTILAEVGLQDPLGLRFLANGTHVAVVVGLRDRAA